MLHAARQANRYSIYFPYFILYAQLSVSVESFCFQSLLKLFPFLIAKAKKKSPLSYLIYLLRQGYGVLTHSIRNIFFLLIVFMLSVSKCSTFFSTDSMKNVSEGTQ